MMSASKIGGSIISMEAERGKLYQLLEEVDEKICLTEPHADEIWKYFVVGYECIKKSDTGVLHISLPVQIRDSLTLDVPQKVNFIVDGTLKATVQFEGEDIGDVVFPLPFCGIPVETDEKFTLDGMLARSAECDGKYSLKMQIQQNLWIMEE